MTRNKTMLGRGLAFGSFAYLAVAAWGCQLEESAGSHAAVSAKARQKPDRVVFGYSASWFDNVYPPESTTTA